MSLKIALLTVAVIGLSACGGTMNLTMMPRDAGTVYAGELQSSGGGAGTMTIDIGDTKCTGPAVRVASNESFGFATSIGYGSRGTVATTTTTSATSGDTSIKAILSCTGGKGLRCDMSGRDSNGGGICVDDAGRVFDVIAARR
jgi:hypothetical protein